MDDGHGGTTVYDPPVGDDSAALVASGTNSVPVETVANDVTTPLQSTLADFKTQANSIVQSFTDELRNIFDDDHGSSCTGVKPNRE